MSASEYLKQFPANWGAFVPGTVHARVLVDPGPPRTASVTVANPVKRSGAPWSRRFERSPEWKALRAKILDRDGGACRKCGSSEELHVDHIKPKARFRDLALDPNNLQVLCRRCNFAKGMR